jgi:hypothetical protein
VRPRDAGVTASIRMLTGLAGALLVLSLSACAAGPVVGAVVGTAAFAAKTTVKAGAAAVRVTGRAAGATARAVTGGNCR